jgi:hypothetical protein
MGADTRKLRRQVNRHLSCTSSTRISALSADTTCVTDASSCSLGAASTETCTAPSGARLDNHDTRPLLALDTQHGKARRRRYGRGFGIESTADKAPDINIEAFRFYEFCRQNGEPTSGLEPLYCSLRVMTQALERVAQEVQIPYIKRGFLSQPCPVLHRIALAVVSDVSLTPAVILLIAPGISSAR